MEQLNSNFTSLSKLYFRFALVLLCSGLVFGLIGAFQYIVPGAMKSYLSFEKIRPMHVSSVVFWIIIAAAGSVLTYIQEHTKRSLFSNRLAQIQLALFAFSILSILISYLTGNFGGREYWEFPPYLSLPIILAWLIFIFNIFKSIKITQKQPVYVWMWLTGCVFFLLTFLESYLWLIPYFRDNIIHDMTIQWKSYGSMVGSWNLLIYGSSIYLMDKISGTKTYSHSKLAFSLFFLGLFNLMFNWGHHVYTLPTHAYVKHISYAVSMTELLIFGRIIYTWKSTLNTAQKHLHQASYKFLLAADIWVFLTLALALCMSIPAINVYTHGTHITVAHTMGATIGINTMLLFAFGFDIIEREKEKIEKYHFNLNKVWITVNVSLCVFWHSLIIAGVLKARWQMSLTQIPFSSMMGSLQPFFITFFISGFVLLVSLFLVAKRLFS
jgi:nitric oxide reductase subunit B